MIDKNNMQKIILASTSIYRKQQLERLNISFSTIAPDVDEDALKAKEIDHIRLSRELSLLKARNISGLNNEAVVIGGDQVASFSDAILGKPETKENAFEQLKLLAGNTHQLITSLAIIANGQEYTHTCIANMKMRQLTDAQISRYIDIDMPLHSCGLLSARSVGHKPFCKH